MSPKPFLLRSVWRQLHPSLGGRRGAIKGIMWAMGAISRKVGALTRRRRAAVLPHDDAVPSSGLEFRSMAGVAEAWGGEGGTGWEDERSSEGDDDDDDSTEPCATALLGSEGACGDKDTPSESLGDDHSSVDSRVLAPWDFDIRIVGCSEQSVSDVQKS